MRLATKTFFSVVAIVVAIPTFSQIGIKEPPPPVPIQGPSLNDTFRWIADNFPVLMAKDDEVRPSVDIEFQGCTAMIFYSKGRPGTRDDRYGDLFEVAQITGFSSVESPYSRNPVTRRQNVFLLIRVPGHAYHYETSAESFGSQAYRTQFLAKMINPPVGNHGVRLHVDTQESADRMANAWGHARDLCRRKVAADKAAEPQKPKGLF